jgi:hypothetical protein
MMIVKLRNLIKNSTFGKVFLLLLLVSFVGGYGLSRSLVKLFGHSWEGIAMINGSDVPYRRFMATEKRERETMEYFTNRFGEQFAQQIRKMQGKTDDPVTNALRTLVKENLVEQQADALAITLSDEYIKPHMQESPQQPDVQEDIVRDLRNAFVGSLLEAGFYLPQFLLPLPHQYQPVSAHQCSFPGNTLRQNCWEPSSEQP